MDKSSKSPNRTVGRFGESFHRRDCEHRPGATRMMESCADAANELMIGAATQVIRRNRSSRFGNKTTVSKRLAGERHNGQIGRRPNNILIPVGQ